MSAPRFHGPLYMEQPSCGPLPRAARLLFFLSPSHLCVTSESPVCISKGLHREIKYDNKKERTNPGAKLLMSSVLDAR